MRRFLTLAAAALVFASLRLPTASAGEISVGVTDHVLTIVGTTEDDAVAVSCTGGTVTIDGVEPVGGPEACSDLREIRIRMDTGNDRVNLAGVGRSAFSNIDLVLVAGDSGDDTLIGSSFADALSGGGGQDSLRGGDGTDRLEPGPGWNEVIGGNGRDLATFSGDGSWSVRNGTVDRSQPVDEETSIRSVEIVKVVGASGQDVLTGGGFSGITKFFGQGGNDLMTSGSNDDLMDGGRGNDWLDATDGNDTMFGGPGDDVLRGGNGNDDMDGGPGSDSCLSGAGADRTISC
jgi:Ca2+-binding RTX toxin-like protein